MSLAYKVEELLALRDSVSESAVSIDKFADEDVIKEHVLRPSVSASANLASRASNRSLRPPTALTLGPVAPDKKPSPSPSIKRGKAEKLLKEHGSPPGLRVTAGGRIVPSDLAPLGISRYSDAYRSQPSRILTENIMSAQHQSSTNSTARIEVIGGQTVVFVGDRMFALPAVDDINPTVSNNGPSSVDTMAKQVPNPISLNTHNDVHGLQFSSARTSTATPLEGHDLATLKGQQSRKKQELRNVEQTEVLQATHQSEAWRASMIEKKRGLIVELDALRKQIAVMETDNPVTAHANPFLNSMGTGSAYLSPLANQFQQAFPPAIYPVPAVNPYTSMIMFQPQPFGALSAFPNAEPTPLTQSSTNAPCSPGSASRRSHAIEIKPPPEDTKKQLTSVLDPKSPTYEPTHKPNHTKGITPPTPSPSKRSLWQVQNGTESNRREHREASQKPSLSSIDTTDFFPTNTHEHSSTRVAPQFVDNKQSIRKDQPFPSTPERHWPASPWNASQSGHSKNNEPASNLTSWSEAFGKQPSLTSLQQKALDQPFSTKPSQSPIKDANMSSSALNHRVPSRTDSGRRTATNENWPFPIKVVAHVPSTYQEGFQAGYDHIGVPDSLEVLHGYSQGLLHFLADESKKRQLDVSAQESYARSVSSNTPSHQGLVAGSLPQDSAISMSFLHNGPTAGGQENLHSTKASPAMDVRRDSAYSPQGSAGGNAVQYKLPPEGAREPRQRIVSNAKHFNPAETFSETGSTGKRQLTMPSLENGTVKGCQDRVASSRVDSFLNTVYTRPTFGAQLQNRGYSARSGTQRFYPSPKELDTSALGVDFVPPKRPFPPSRMSGMDGAMDDLAELMSDTGISEGCSPVKDDSAEARVAVDSEEVNASCFKSSESKGKQKVTSSPVKVMDASGDGETCSPGQPGSSPKKSGEHSPAKAKLEQVTNKFRRVKKDDARAMSSEERVKRSEKWRQRFQQLKRSEIEEIEAHRKYSRA